MKNQSHKLPLHPAEQAQVNNSFDKFNKFFANTNSNLATETGYNYDKLDDATSGIDQDPTDTDNQQVAKGNIPVNLEDDDINVTPEIDPQPVSNRGANYLLPPAGTTSQLIPTPIPYSNIPVEDSFATHSISIDPQYTKSQRYQAIETLNLMRSLNSKVKTPQANLQTPLPVTMDTRELMSPNSHTDPQVSNQEKIKLLDIYGRKHKNIPNRRSNVLSGEVGKKRFYIDADSIYPKGAPFSAKLMRTTGDEARPLYGQIQVAEQRQLFEPGVKQYVRNPNVTEELLTELIAPPPLLPTEQESTLNKNKTPVGLKSATQESTVW